MRVGQRLMLAVTPAVVGVVAVAALAYWGQYARQAPEIVIIVAAAAAVGSLVLAWRNTRYVAHRIEHLAGRAGERTTAQESRADELDEIERSVHVLTGEVRSAQSELAEREAASERRSAEMTALLHDLTGQVAERLSEVQLPLHILLDSPFGELNENQEEMLHSARDAAEAADVRVRQVQKFVELERGAVQMQVRPVGLAELLRPAIAIAEARARKRGVALRATVSPSAPRVVVDPVHAQEAVTLALVDVVDRAATGGEVHVETAEAERSTVIVRVTGAAGDAAASLPLRLAERLIRAQGGAMRQGSGELVIEMLVEGLRPVARG
jgi:signal transduction histidine kinase